MRKRRYFVRLKHNTSGEVATQTVETVEGSVTAGQMAVRQQTGSGNPANWRVMDVTELETEPPADDWQKTQRAKVEWRSELAASRRRFGR